MNKFLIMVSLLGCSVPITAISAQSVNEEAAIIATIDALFEGLRKQDRAGLEAITVPGSLNISSSPDNAGEVRLTVLGYQELITALSRAGAARIERYWDATVLIQGSIAVFWAPYDFHIDGKFSHCGIDSFQLVKQEGKWLISNLSWTREVENCPESPLGPIN